jgi:hypothetical protein
LGLNPTPKGGGAYLTTVARSTVVVEMSDFGKKTSGASAAHQCSLTVVATPGSSLGRVRHRGPSGAILGCVVDVSVIAMDVGVGGGGRQPLALLINAWLLDGDTLTLK